MNIERRKKLRAVITLLDIVETKLTDLMDEEEEALYNIPESLQYTDKYMQMESNIEVFDELIGAIVNAKEEMECM